ncbi:hypothetical protein [Chitinophaga varians]|uniref:hypothetical protein n=1 Tax=Chitinophaga varians TaxID=2202339 RepID=UPI00165EDA16|nr:hypothetical protein [Chitinophaga varians]MBC9908796.1 hypothetical protein [Chitinophaga varians]
MKYCLHLLLLLCSCLLLNCPTYAGGLSAWTESTPGGNKMEYDGTAPAMAFFSGAHCDSLQFPIGLKSWYFYKNHVIGEDGSTFYVIREESCQVHRFTSEVAFKAYLSERQLKPWIWKRTYHPLNIWDYFDELVFMSFFFSPVLLLLLIADVVILVGLLRGKKQAYWKYAFLSAIPLVYIIGALLQGFPQSW